VNLYELKALLDQTGYPVSYSHFNSPPNPPYIAYLVAFSSNFHADNQVYAKIENAQVELYTEYKDPSVEKTLEDIFKDNEIPWDDTETWIETEQLFQRIYEIGVI